jgi:hypothetical protein
MIFLFPIPSYSVLAIEERKEEEGIVKTYVMK